MKQKDALGQFEQLVMTALVLLRDRATGMTLQAKISELSERNVNLGSVYVTLDRMEEKHYVESWLGDPTPERGGRRKRYYRLLPAGERALSDAISTARRMQEAVEESPWWRFKWRLGRAKS